MWEYPPYRVEPEASTFPWALATRAVFERVASHADRAFTGVVLRRLSYVYDGAEHVPADLASPPFASLLRGFAAGPAPAECGPGFAASWSHDVPVACMALYLPWLEQQALSLGVRIVSSAALSSLADAALLEPGSSAEATLLVNACGLGSNPLLPDPAVGPVRGALVYVRSPVEACYSQEPRGATQTPTYVIPQSGGVVALGGLAQPGATSLDVSADEVGDIRARCARLLPALASAPVVGTWAGLRPYRAPAGVRLELQRDAAGPGRDVVHNYGHGACCAARARTGQRRRRLIVLRRVPSSSPSSPLGPRAGGSGVTLSWGCAQAVAGLAAGWACARGLELAPAAIDTDAPLASLLAAG